MTRRHFRSPFNILILLSALTTACSDTTGESSVEAFNDQGTSYAEARQTGTATLRVLYVPAAGFAVEEEGELQGVSVEIMRDFQRWFERYHSISLQLEFVAEEDWSVFYQRVANAEGGVFGFGNVTITEERRQELAFSPAYLLNVAVLISPSDYPEFSSVDDLARHGDTLKPLAFSSTLHEVRVRTLRDHIHPEQSITEVSTNQAILDKVSQEHFYSYIDAYNYHRAVNQGIDVQYHPAFNQSGERFGIIMPHSNDWQTALTAFFAAEGGYLNTERYRAILQTHLGEEVADILLEAQ